MRRVMAAVIVLLASEMLFGISLDAATRNWTGTTSGTWSDPSNWGGTAPLPGDDLVFGSANNATVLHNDYPANTAFHSLSFSISGDLSGNAINLGAGGITVTVTGSLNTSAPLTLTAPQTWSCAASSEVATPGGGLSVDLGANTLNLAGGGLVVFQGDVNGTGGIAVGGTATMASLTSLNYTGPTTINSGAALSIQSTGSVLTPITIASGGQLIVPVGSVPSLSSTLALNSGSTYKVQINGAAPAEYSEVVLSGASAVVTIAGNLSLNSSTILAPGSVLTILDTSSGASLSGTFAGLPEGATVSSGVQSYLVHYTSTSVTLTALAGTAAPPSLSKAFGAADIPVGGSTSLTFTLNNPNAGSSLSGVGFNDPLPAGLSVATPNGVSGSCGGGTITATAGSGSVSLSGATLAPSAGCTFSINVTGTSAGAMNNQTTNVASTEGGNGNQGTATLNVDGPPTISKAFGAPSIPVGGTTTLTFTLGNPASNPDALIGVTVGDSLPSGMTVASPSGASTNCSGATFSPVVGASTLSLSGATINSGTVCTAVVTVTSSTPGTANNTSGAVSAANGGTGSTASASLTVLPAGAATPPALSKSFGAAQIPVGSSTSLTFTVTNPNGGSTLTNVGFSDPLPAGLVVTTPNGLSGSCVGGTITATAGSGSVSLSGATLAPSAGCTFSINVTGTSGGAKNNQTTNVTSTEGGTGNQGTAILNVDGPPTISKAFSATSIVAGGTTTLTFTLGNPASNPDVLSGVAFTDSMPAGMTVASPSGATTNCSGATFNPVVGAPALSFSGATINSGTTCTAVVNVTSSTPGTANNTSGAVSAANGGTGSTANASVTVSAAAPNAPTLSMWALFLLVLALALIAAMRLS